MSVQNRTDKLADALAGEIKSRRLARGLSMNELSAKAGLAVSFIGYVERGMRRPSVETLARIAWALDLQPSDFLIAAEQASRVRKAE